MYLEKCFVSLSQVNTFAAPFFDTDSCKTGDVLKAKDFGLDGIVVYENPCDVMKSYHTWLTKYSKDMPSIYQCEATDCVSEDPDIDKKIMGVYSASEIRIVKKMTVQDVIHEQWMYGKSELDYHADGCYNGESTDIVSTESYSSIAAESFWDSRIIVGGHCSYAFMSGTKNMVSASGDYANVFCVGALHNISTMGGGSCVYIYGHHCRITMNGDNGIVVSNGYENCITVTEKNCWIFSNSEGDLIFNIGARGRARSKKGSWITLAYYPTERSPIVKTERVDGERIKEDTWYEFTGEEFTEVHV